jgi:hypothetical protein
MVDFVAPARASRQLNFSKSFLSSIIVRRWDCMPKCIKPFPINGAIFAVLFIFLGFLPGLYAQSSRTHPKAVSRPETVVTKLTPEQSHGMRLLLAAEGESSELQPDMHAFVLWRASYAYIKLDPPQALKLSRDAFLATQAIEDASERDQCVAPGSAGDMKSWIQRHVLYDMVHKDQPHEVEQLLPQATTSVRNEITAELVRYYNSKKDLIHSELLLSQLADSARYPFGAAANLVTGLPAEHSTDRVRIFIQALNNFEQHAAETGFGGEDIGSFIERTWKDVPPGLVLEAIEKVLDGTKERGSHSSYSISSSKGSVVLNSEYSLRLFQLLPIIQELDKDKAEALLREHAEVAEQLKAYPKGIQSFNSENVGLSYRVTDGDSGIAAAAAKDQVSAQMQDQIQEILKTADTVPAVALMRARTLPIHGTFPSRSPRSDALLGIAKKTAATKPSVSQLALDDFSTILDQVTPQELTGIDLSPELYLKMGDVDGAKKAVDILVKAAGKLHEKDTDADDPNKAFKGAWPSTDLWRRAVLDAAKISPRLAEDIIASLDDAEIATFEKVALGSVLVGGSATDIPVLVSDCRKNGASYRVSSSR